MRTVGLVTEYNPFHNGHLYHLTKSKEITNSQYSVAVMSGNFVQRGEPALIDKWTRAKMAIDNGVDLVLELPTIYAIQSAEFFAYGAVKILESLGIIDCMVFGSEIGNIETLRKIADVLIKEPPEFKEYLKKYLNLGNPFPLARSKAVEEYYQKKDNQNSKISEILSSPNNILAIEYLKALNKIGSKIVPYTIQRIGTDYNATKLSGHISSATSIRKHLLDNNNFNTVKDAIPNFTCIHLNEYFEKYKSFNQLKNYEEILLYLLRTAKKEHLKKILDIEEGLENRIINCSNKYNSLDKILGCVNTKRYTYTRLQRILIHLLLGLDGETFLNLHKLGPLYIRVLGFSAKGIDLLSRAKKVSKLPIITKFKNYKNLNNIEINQMIDFDIKATNIYFMGFRKNHNYIANLDYYISPYIKK